VRPALGALWRHAALVAACACLGALAACGGGGGGSSSPSASATSSPPATSGVPAGGAPIFDPTVLHEARLDLDPSAWQALRDNYLSNQYYAANFSVDGVSVSQVGVRSRGSGSRNEEKPGMKVDMNKYVQGQEYYGYKSVDLDNLVTDASMLRERLSFLVFEAMGIQSPRNAFCRLTVNGQYWGVYAIVEPVSKPFLKSRLGEESGNLFDYEWTFHYDFSFLGGDPDEYVPLPFQPETNEDHEDVADGLVAFIEAVNNAPTAGFASAIGARLDVDRFLTHVAVENALAESDGIVGDQGLNNFYLYEYGQKNRFVFIPWDKDNTFRSGSWPLMRNLEDNILTDRLIADPAKRQVYVDAVVRATSSYVNSRWLTPQLETAYQQIRAAVLGDVRKPFSNGQFEAAVDGVRGVINAREHDVNAQK
jgi:spore coat protein CotH